MRGERVIGTRSGITRCVVDLPEHEQAVDEGRDEGAEGQLVAAVAHEVGNQSRTEVRARKGDGHHRDREGRARDTDDRAGDRGQYRSRAIGLRLPDPAEETGRIDAVALVERRYYE